MDGNASSDQTRPYGFLDLPIELRLMIYDCILEIPLSPGNTNGRLNVLDLNTQIFHDAAPVLITEIERRIERCGTVAFTPAPKLADMEQQPGGEGTIKTVRDMELQLLLLKELKVKVRQKIFEGGMAGSQEEVCGLAHVKEVS
jgi:hypothetical protein